MGFFQYPPLTGTGSATAGSFIPTSSTVPTNGMYLPAANTLGFAANSTAIFRMLSSGGPNLRFETASAGTGFVYQAVDNGLLHVSGGSGSGSGLNIQMYGGTHATLPGRLNIRQNTTTVFSIAETTGLITLGASGGTQTHQANGSLLLTGRFANGGSLGSSAMLKLNGNDRTGTTQVNVDATTFTGTSAATTAIYGILSGVTTAAASFTSALVSNFYSQNIAAGAGSTITRRVGFYVEAPTGGANNANIADNATFTGSKFISQTGTSPSDFGGYVQISNQADPGAVTDGIRLGSVDISAGNATLSLRTERAVAVDVAVASTHSLSVQLNGTTYRLLLAV